MGAIQTYGIVDGELSGSQRWRSFFSMFMFATVGMYLQVKVTPVITNIAADLGMPPAQAGLLFSAAAFAALIFSIPAAAIMRKLGIKATLLLAGALAVIGSLIGLLGGAHVATFVLSRALEGISLAFGSVVGAAVIPRLFEGKGMGLAMGAWSLWSLPGTIISFFSTPLLYGAGGWKAMWIFSIVFALIAVVWMFFDFKLPSVSGAAAPAAAAVSDAPARKPHAVSAVVVAACMTVWAFCFGAIVVYYPTYLQEVKGLSVFVASVVTVVVPIVAAPFGLWFGVLSEKLRARKWFICIPFAILALINATITFSPSASLVPTAVALIIYAVCAAAIPMGIYSLVPELARNEKVTDYAMGVTGAGLQLGNVLAGLCGPIIAATSYYGYSLRVVVPAALIAAVAVLLCKSERAE